MKHPYLILMRWNKPIPLFLLLWPTLWALWIANLGKPNFLIVGIFVLGVVLMRSAGCIINDFADRNFDRFVRRTAHRPLTTQQVSAHGALILFCILLFLSFLLVLLLNTLTLKLAFVGAFIAIVYPFMKRFTHLPQLGLGVAFSWGIPMAFAASLNSLPKNMWILFFAATLWPVIYDTMYAMADRDDDQKIGIKSTAILFGQHEVILIGILQLCFFTLLLWCGSIFHLRWPYFCSLLLSLPFFLYQLHLIRHRQPQACLQAFLNNHWIGVIIFVGILLSYTL